MTHWQAERRHGTNKRHLQRTLHTTMIRSDLLLFIRAYAHHDAGIYHQSCVPR